MRLTSLITSVSSAFILLQIIGCSGTPFNQTAFPYYYNSEKLEQKPIEKLVIADVNFGPPSKGYIDKYAAKVDQKLIDRLRGAGYEVVERSIFQSAWQSAVRKYGLPFNKDTSQKNPAAFKRVMLSTLHTLRESGEVDAVVFTDLIERQVSFGYTLNRSAKWDGVSRKPRLKSGAEGVSPGFDWSQNVPAISLSVTIYDTDGAALFKSVGGLEVTRQLDAINGNGRFVRREKMLRRAAHLKEGVSLALHPIVIMKNYPDPNGRN